MEEEIEVQEVKKEREIYWSASEVFTILSEKEFTKIVLPFIKAYYKHHYGNELYLHEHDTKDVSMIVYVDRESSKIMFYHEPADYNSSIEGEIKNDRKDLTPENIFDYLYYEYKQLFQGDPCMVEPEKKKVTKKEIKITL
jgi:hypothetical protein